MAPEPPKEPPQERQEIPSWLHEEMGVPLGMLEHIGQDTPWMFVIKWHAILETFANYLLAQYFDRPESNKAFARLEMSNPTTGKMLFLNTCNILPKEHLIFITRLSQMRNWAVHYIKNFDFSFERFRDEKIKKGDLNSWHQQIAIGAPHFLSSPKENRDIQMAVNSGCITVLVNAFMQQQEGKPTALIHPLLAHQKPPSRGQSKTKESRASGQ